MFVFVKYYPTYWCVFDVARSEVSLKAAHYQRGVHHRPRGGVFADLAGKDRDKDRVGACCADRERCEQDGEQTAPPVLAQPLQCFPPAKLRCDVSANYDKDGSGCGQPTIRAAPIIAEVKPFASSGGGDIVGVDLISCRARELYLRQCFVGHLDLSEPNLCEPRRGAWNLL